MSKYLIIPIFLIVLSCGQKPESTSTTSAEESASAASSTEASIINPNLATRDELLAIAQLEEQHVDNILAARPFIASMDFIQTLQSSFDDEVVSEILAVAYVPMNLNTVAEKDFMNVPGVGEKMAHEFEEYRPYTSVEQFRREIGKYVDEAEVARYEQFVFVPVELNTGSKEEILAIPGVGKRMLHEFEEYRPYVDMEQWRREIGKYVDDNELKRLERYVTLRAEE